MDNATLLARLEELEAENRLLWALINQVPHYLYSKNTEHKFTILNVATSRSFGTDNPKEIIGKSDRELHPPELAEKFIAEEKRIMDSRVGLYDQEQLTFDPDSGDEVWLSTSKIPILDEKGVVEGLVGFAEDISRRKRIEKALDEKSELVESQQAALREVSTPILPILDRILVMPLIGTIDSQRALNIMRALLESISQHRAKIIILDITGVPLIDTGVADHLHRTLQAARLKGAQTVITGVSDAVAETLVDLGIDWSTIETTRDLQSGLRYALDKLNQNDWN